MVALKPSLRSTLFKSPITKQERRGGIETSRSSRTSPTQSGKQERRGGIETFAFARYGRCIPRRSRNAVVALKLDHVPAGTSFK